MKMPTVARSRPTKRHRPAGKRQAAPEPSVPDPPRTGIRWRAVLIAIACVLTYWNSLSGAFVLDDQGAIVENAQIREWWRPSAVLWPASDSSVAGRPLPHLSLAINYAIGGLDVRGYHVWNIAVHVACALLLFGIVRRTLEVPGLRAKVAGRSLDLAFAVALLWTVHPLNTEVVDYLSQRTESMMAMFYLSTVYAGIRAFESKRSAAWRAAAAVSCVLAVACKESAVTAPVVMAIYDRVFLFDSWKRAFRSRGSLYLGLAASWLVLIALSRSGPRSAVAGFSTGVPIWTYLLNQTVTITTYLRLVVWPRSLVVFYGWPVPLTLGDVLPQAMAVGALAIGTLVGFRFAPQVAFTGAWFFITLAPTSSIVPISTEVGAERRMYLPLIAVIALAVVGAYLLVDYARRRSSVAARVLAPRAMLFGGAVTLLVLSGALAARSAARNREYASALSLARTVVERRPTPVAHHILGEQLLQAGQRDEAVKHLREATRGDSKASYALGVELYNQGKMDEAVAQLTAFLGTWGLPYRLVPRWLEPTPMEVVLARTALARVAAMRGQWREVAEQCQKILAMQPSNLEGRGLLADALFSEQRFAEAEAHYSAYLKMRPDDPHALTNLGVSLVAQGRMQEAVARFRRGVQIDPQNANARRVLALALLDSGDYEQAAREARESLALRPNDDAARDVLNRALAAGRGAAKP
jgi:tetratricopeptide (TPR) repeat protein